MVAGGTNSSGTGDKGVDELRARCERCLGQLGELTGVSEILCVSYCR